MYCRCPLEVLIERDVKGWYKKALAGEVENFTGVSDPYEEPLNAEIVVDTDRQTPEESLAVILSYLERNGYVEAAPVDETVYSPEEEAEIEERLRSLGYL